MYTNFEINHPRNLDVVCIKRFCYPRVEIRRVGIGARKYVSHTSTLIDEHAYQVSN